MDSNKLKKKIFEKTFVWFKKLQNITYLQAQILIYYEIIVSKLEETDKRLLGILLNKDIRVLLYTRVNNTLDFLLEVGEHPTIKNNGTFKTEDKFKDYGDNLEECFGVLAYQEDSCPLSLKVVVYEKPIEFLHNKSKLIGRQGVAFVLDEQSPFKEEFEEKKRDILDLLIQADLSSTLVPPTKPINQVEVDFVIGIFENLLLSGTWGMKGPAFFRKKIEFFMSRGLPIIFMLAGFPFKSPNKMKVTGHLPDKAEELAFENLVGFCKEVRKVYSPGAKIVIHNDSQLADILIDSQDRYKVTEYLIGLRKMALENGYNEHIFFQGLDKYFETAEYFLHDMTKVFELCGHNQTSIKAKYQTDHPSQYNKFIGQDMTFRNQSKVVSGHQFKNHLVKKAIELYFIYKYADRFIRTNLMPLALRINIHTSENNGPGFSVKLFAGRDAKGDEMNMTPWHSVAVEYEEGKYCLMHKENITEREYEPVYRGTDTPYYYKKKIQLN